MIRIGMIGSIGSGKTFIARLFNYPVFNADIQVNKIYKSDKKCFYNLKKKLPRFIKSFPIIKKELIEAIKENKKNLNIISSVVHPIVRKKLNDFIKKNKKSKIIVLDVPLLIENKLNNKNDVLIFVESSKIKILARLKKRSNYNREVLKNLIENQVRISKKKRLANYIVDNNFSPNIMKKKIKLLRTKILNERNSFRH